MTPALAGAAAGTNSGQDKIFISRLIGSDVLPTSHSHQSVPAPLYNVRLINPNDLNHEVYFSYLSLVIVMDYIMIISLEIYSIHHTLGDDLMTPCLCISLINLIKAKLNYRNKVIEN